MERQPICRGVHGNYQWLTSTEVYSGTLFQFCPEIVADRYVAVTAIDGGAWRPSDRHRAAGWYSHNNIAYSPRVNSSDELPYQVDGPDASGYDEFYVFQKPTDLGNRCHGNLFLKEFAPAPGRAAVFVTWADFVLSDPDPNRQHLVNLFWGQLERLQPEPYIADGCLCLNFVSRNQALVNLLYDRLTSPDGWAPRL